MTNQHEVVTRVDQLTFSGVVFTEFKGKLVDMEFPIENGTPKTKLQFVEMNVIKTKAPYLHPAAEIVMNRASKRNGEFITSDRGPWGCLIVSSDAQGYLDITELKGHTLHMVATQNKIEANAERGTEAGSFTTWEILSVDGVDKRLPSDDSAPAVSTLSADNTGDNDPK